MDTSRRQFLIGSTALAGSALLTSQAHAAPTTPPVAAAQCEPEKPFAMKGALYGFGMTGRLSKDQMGKVKKNVCVITTIDINTGNIRQTPLDMAEGHAAMGMGDGRIMCVAHHRNKSMMLDPDHKVRSVFIAPEGYVFGGHGLVLAEQNVFIMPLRSEMPRELKDEGRMQVYDLKTEKLIEEVATGGLHPHEVCKIPGHDELAVTHYGDVYQNKKPFAHNVIAQKLSVLDSKTFKPLRHYPEEIFAMVTHMRVDKHGWAHYVLTQYVEFPKKVELQPGQDALSFVMEEAEKFAGKKFDFPIPYQAGQEKLMAVPLPFIKVNTQTGERKLIDTGMKNHLRSQSVAYHEETDTMIALYYYSDLLVLSNPEKGADIITSFQLQLRGIRGVTDIPGTPYIAVCGTWNDMAVMDLRTRKVVARYEASLYNSTHLYFDGAAV